MARTPRILDQYGRPITRIALKGEQAPPGSSPLRTLTELAASRALSPAELATLLSAAANGDLFSQVRLFDAMEEKDAHILAEMGKRKRALAACEWQILPWDDSREQERMTAFIEEVLEGIDVEATLYEMADAIGKGVSCQELIWDVSSGQAAVSDIRPRPLEWFQWGMGRLGQRTDELRLRDNSLDGQELTPGKWLVHRHPARSGSPFKAPLFRTIAWLFLFRNYGIKGWAQFLEAYGIPVMVGKYPVGSPKGDQDLLLDALEDIASRAAVAIPQGMEIEIKELAAKGGGGLHQAFLDWAAREISKAILGQTLTSDTDGRGSYSLGQVHNEVRHDILRHDARLIETSFQRQVIRPLAELNFGPRRAVPRFRLTVRRPEDLKTEAETIKLLAEAGFDAIPIWWLREKFNIPAPQEGDLTLGDLAPQTAQNRTKRANTIQGIGQGRKTQQRGSQAQNSRGSRGRFTGDQEELERFMAKMSRIGSQAMNGIQKALLQAILDAEGYEDAMSRVLELYPSLDAQRFMNVMEQAILNAHLFGEYVAQETMEDDE